jgi:hypothetical protein
VLKIGSPPNTACSVHPIPDKERRGHSGGSRRVFRRCAWLGVGSGKAALSRPAHQRLTQTVRRLTSKIVACQTIQKLTACRISWIYLGFVSLL